VCVLVAPLAISNHAPPFLTPDVYAPPSLRLTSNSWCHFTFSDKTACLNLNIRPPACLSVCLPVCLCICICTCLSHLSLLLFYYYIVIIRDFILHTDFTLCLAPSRPAPTRKQSRTFSSYPPCLTARHPSAPACSAATFVAGQIGPFLFTLYPPAREALSSSHWSRLETRHLPVLFFYPVPPPSSPLELSASLDLLAHRQNSRDLQLLAGICVLWLASLLTIPPTYTHIPPTQQPLPSPACLHYPPTHFQHGRHPPRSISDPSSRRQAKCCPRSRPRRL
jgi:hypothetical protein